VLLPGLEDDARALVLDVLGGTPGPALDALGPHDDLRETLGMDSLDFPSPWSFGSSSGAAGASRRTTTRRWPTSTAGCGC
jgi:hypothetical protein